MRKPKKDAPPPLTLSYRKLGKEKARGQFIPHLNVIELDPRLEGEEHLEVLTHEAIHFLLPFLDEEAVEKAAVNLAHILWVDGYRKEEEP
jgi:hypothetical protein